MNSITEYLAIKELDLITSSINLKGHGARKKAKDWITIGIHTHTYTHARTRAHTHTLIITSLDVLFIFVAIYL